MSRQLDTHPGSWTDTNASTAGTYRGSPPSHISVDLAWLNLKTRTQDPLGRDGLAPWTFGEILAEVEQLERDCRADICRRSC